MLRYFLKRILMLIPVMIGATLMVFTIMEFSPGDPARIILGDDTTDEAVAQLRQDMGLDKPFAIRYVNYIVNFCKGDMGISYRNRLPVGKQILERLPNTLILAGSAALLAIIIGMPIGVISALKQYTFFDNITMLFALLMAAAPVFWLGLILVIIFALHLGWVPAAGMGQGSKLFISLILPAVTLCGSTSALIARTTRSSMLEVMRQDYIDTARSKGIKERVVTLHHMLRNALIPIITVVGLQFGVMLGGSVMVESIFSWPGVGRFVVDSIKAKDIPSVLGSVITLAILFTIVNLLVDMLYAVVDPRIKSQYKRSKLFVSSRRSY